MNRYVNRVFDEAWASEREMDLWKKLPRDECIRYAEPNEPITLGTARRIAFRLEVPILELLEATRPTIQSFGFAAESPLPAPMQPAQKLRYIDGEKLRTELERISEASATPTSLRQVGRSLSVSVGAIQYHAADFAERIINAHTEFKAAEALRRRREAAEAVRKALRARGDEPALSRKGLLKKLIGDTGLPKNLLLAEIKAQWEA